MKKRQQVVAKTGKDSASYATPALDKGLDIIELLATRAGSLTKSQIARELNRTVSQIFRMLVCLERRGYIAQVKDDEYALTLKLFQLIQEHPPTERLIADALPIMNHFSQQTLQSCHMGVIEGGRVVILAQVNAPTSTGFFVKLGSTVDIMDASTGYVILAHQDDAVQQQTLAEWQRITGKKIPGNLKAHLQRIRKKGYEERSSYQIRGVVNMTFPIFDERHSAVGALTTPYIALVGSKNTRALTLAALRRSSEEISRAMGART